RGSNGCRVGESILGTGMSQNLSRGSDTLVAREAVKEGVATLRESGLRKVKAGILSLEELNRVTKD
ncbi:MAG: hypothetical protein AB2813_10985, partial [Candidatus Sedimenticola endophacoides]